MTDIFSKCIISIIIFVLFNSFACRSQNEVNPKLANEMPPKILWAWERPEDLRFLETDKFGVAFLAQTLTLQNDKVIFRPRRQPLEVADGTYLIAVTRIETIKDRKKSPGIVGRTKKRSCFVDKKNAAIA